MGLRRADKASVFWLLFPFFGLWLFFWLVPLFFGVDLALQNPGYSPEHRDSIERVNKDSVFHFNWLNPPTIEIEETESIKYVGLENFSRVLSDDKFYKALKNTSFYVFGSIMFILPLGFALSLALFQLSRMSRGFLVFCLLIPSLALPSVLSTLFYLFFHGRTGALNQYFVIPLGFAPVNWMMDPLFIMPSLIMQSVWRWTGLVTLFFLCGLEAIPRWQWEVVKLEGVGFWMRIRKIFLPNLWHLVLFAVVFLVVDGFASFSGAYNLLGGSGGIMDAGLLLVTYVYQVAFPGGSGRFDFPGAAAMSLLIVPITAFILFIILQTRHRWSLR
ncbi:MAG: sugar ABC transporter permease [Opitutae bacterium]|nr:sugar ABC transporter permease [Opitutae bacterium]MBT5717126.1 sugar ABC transporter permease [Opitutae bacterium]